METVTGRLWDCYQGSIQAGNSLISQHQRRRKWTKILCHPPRWKLACVAQTWGSYARMHFSPFSLVFDVTFRTGNHFEIANFNLGPLVLNWNDGDRMVGLQSRDEKNDGLVPKWKGGMFKVFLFLETALSAQTSCLVLSFCHNFRHSVHCWSFEGADVKRHTLWPISTMGPWPLPSLHLCVT